MSSIQSAQPAAERLRMAFDLFEAGVAMERQRLRRRFPDLVDAAVESRLVAWLQRVGEPGDADGTEVEWPRQRDEPTA